MEKQVSPPCQAACPIHQDVREYVSLIAQGKFDQALEVIRKTNPLPASCGYICAHHCQDECRRKDVDGSISIKLLKRFAEENSQVSPPVSTGGEKVKQVAIVGSGPAGLAAAQSLVRKGYGVTIFEREPQAGGALRNYIPLYRLPHEAIDRDISSLEKEGVQFEMGCEMGRDFTPGQLLDKGYDVVLLCLGLPRSRTLDIPGANSKNVLMALPFLYNVKFKGFRLQGENVIVIGGGNVAMDVARSARRGGASQVKVVCLESRSEMPAFPWEIEEAIEEGIKLYCSKGPKAILTAGEKITGLETKGVISVFDEQGHFNPKYDEQTISTIDGDLVIFAIGQAGEIASLEKSNVPLDDRGRMIFNSETMTTVLEGVFACGEVVEGPGTAVQAMAAGQKAAEAIDRFLQGEKLETVQEAEAEAAVAAELKADTVLPKLPEAITGKIKQLSQVAAPIVDCEKRVTNFDPIEFSYTLMQALQESRRCLRCGIGAVQDEELCAHCLTCMRTCPYDVPFINEEGLLELRHDFCQACGLCLAICPAKAIAFQSPEVEAAQASIASTLEKMAASVNGHPKLLIFTCSYAPFAMDCFNNKLSQVKSPEVEIIKWPCVAKIDSLDMLRAFEHGADAVIIAGCTENGELTCPYFDTLAWVEKRLHHAQNTMEVVGLAKEQLSLASIPAIDAEAFNILIQEKITALKA